MAGKRTIPLNESYFDTINTPEKAYWLGFIAADGSVDGIDCLSIKLKDVDTEHLHLCRQCLESGHKMRYGINSIGVHWAQIRFHSKRLVESLGRHGVNSDKAWDIKPWMGNDDLVPHYWRGVVDGDGWVSTARNGNTARFWTVGLCGNQYMVKGFADFVRTALGYKNEPTTRRVKNYEQHKHLFYQVAYTGTHRAASVCRLLKYDDESAIALKRKQSAAAQITTYTPTQKAMRLDIAPELARQIAIEYADGATVKDLTARYDVGNGTVYNITHRLGRYADMELPPNIR